MAGQQPRVLQPMHARPDKSGSERVIDRRGHAVIPDPLSRARPLGGLPPEAEDWQYGQFRVNTSIGKAPDFDYQNLFAAKALPEPDLKYRSSSLATFSVEIAV